MCPSLRDVAQQSLGLKLADTHNSIEDAQSSMRAAMHVLQHGSPQPFSRSVPLGQASPVPGVPAGALLLLHRLPEGTTEEVLMQMLIAHAKVVPAAIQFVSASGQAADEAPSSPAPGAANGKALAVFQSEQHAGLAFDSITGPNRPDKGGRAQKRVYLKAGGYICVRKYV